MTTGHRWVGRWLAVGGLLVAALAFTACNGAGVMCDYGLPDATIIGRLITRDGSTTTFLVEAVVQTTPNRPAPGPVVGRTVIVDYFDHTSRFLHVGKRYRVELSGYRNGRFGSDLHIASRACSRGTWYADGSAIDTRTWFRAHLAEIIGVAVLVPLLVAGIFVGAMKFLGRATRGHPKGDAPVDPSR